jgi:hypothetical protein
MSWLKRKMFNWALKKLFPIFKLENVLTANKAGVLFLDQKPIEGKKLANLKEQARLLKNGDLWIILTETMMFQAQRIMFNESKDFQDLINGKMVLYTLDVLQKTIEKIDKTK